MVKQTGAPLTSSCEDARDESLHKKRKKKCCVSPVVRGCRPRLSLRSQWAIQMAANQNGCAGQVCLSPLRLTGSTKLVTAGRTENVNRNEVSMLSRFLTERIENLPNTAVKSTYVRAHHRPKLKQKLYFWEFILFALVPKLSCKDTPTLTSVC